jgi:hypothetical protein
MRHQAVPRPATEPSRDSIGGFAFLPLDLEWPVHDGKRMVLFFQFDVRAEFGIALAPGSHVVAFMSPSTNEIPTFDFVTSGAPLPDRFWEKQMQHFRVFVFPPDAPLVASAEPDAHIEHHALDFVPNDQLGDPFLFVGGAPQWYQDAEEHPGFSFIAQLSENYPFAKLASAPSQPDSFSKKAYCLFLGNSVYLFARATPSDPREVWVVVQN